MLFESMLYYSRNDTSLLENRLKNQIIFPSTAPSSNNHCMVALPFQVHGLFYHRTQSLLSGDIRRTKKKKNASGRIVVETTQKFAVVEVVPGNKKC